MPKAYQGLEFVAHFPHDFNIAPGTNDCPARFEHCILPFPTGNRLAGITIPVTLTNGLFYFSEPLQSNCSSRYRRSFP